MHCSYVEKIFFVQNPGEVFSGTLFGSSLSILDFVALGSSLSLRSFARRASGLSVRFSHVVRYV